MLFWLQEWLIYQVFYPHWTLLIKLLRKQLWSSLNPCNIFKMNWIFFKKNTYSKTSVDISWFFHKSCWFFWRLSVGICSHCLCTSIVIELYILIFFFPISSSSNVQNYITSTWITCWCALVSLITSRKHIFETRLKLENIFAFSDSFITIDWIHSKSYHWKTFTSNRITKIYKNVSWIFVPGTQNVDDSASRGLLSNVLINHFTWLSRFTWLASDVSDWSVKYTKT